MLYLIKSGNYLKIGSAKNIKERLKLYTTHNPDFELLDQKEGNIYDEKELQRLCKQWQHHTEWFHYNEEIIKIFKEFTPKNTEHIYTFLIMYENKPQEEIVVDSCNSYKEAVQYILKKYQSVKSVYRIYYMSGSRICVYPDGVIHEQEKTIEKLFSNIERQSILIDKLIEENNKLKEHIEYTM